MYVSGVSINAQSDICSLCAIMMMSAILFYIEHNTDADDIIEW